MAFSKQKTSKLVKELDLSKSENLRLNNTLQVGDIAFIDRNEKGW